MLRINELLQYKACTEDVEPSTVKDVAVNPCRMLYSVLCFIQQLAQVYVEEELLDLRTKFFAFWLFSPSGIPVGIYTKLRSGIPVNIVVYVVSASDRKFMASMLTSFEQPLNILAIVVTFEV